MSVGLAERSGPAIEEIAADLGRLLREHDMFARSNFTPIRGWRLRLLEAAITARATQAANVLGLPDSERPAYGSFDNARLSRLLRDLAIGGFVLPPVGLLASNL